MPKRAREGPRPRGRPKRGLWIASVVLGIVLVVSACDGESVDVRTTTGQLDVMITITPGTSTTTSEPVDITPTVESLVVNGMLLESGDSVYVLPGVVNPGDVLRIEATIRDDESGALRVFDVRDTYAPTPEGIEAEVTVTVPADLTAPEIPIMLGNEQVAAIGFEPGEVWPPIVVVDAPTEATVGERVVLDASGTFDFNGDPFTIEWSQTRNPDRYAGDEYVTSQRVELETTFGPVTGFSAEWPGNYRFVATASDEGGVSSYVVDVAVHPSSDLLSIRGMAIDGINEPWSTANAQDLLGYVKSLGFNYVQVGLHDTMASPSSTEILIDGCRENWVPTLDEYMDLVDLAHDTGLGVMLSPALGCFIDGVWYEGYNITPTDRAEWMTSYHEYAVFYAELAEAHDVEILNLGGGLEEFYVYADTWGQLLDDVRSVYSGRISFSWFAHPLFGRWPEFAHIDDLDLLVSPFQWNGTGESIGEPDYSVSHNYPSIEEMIGHFDDSLAQYVDRVTAEYDKSVIVSDLYPWSVDGMNIDTGSIYWTPSGERVADHQEPIDYTEAAFRTMIDRGWEGVFLWALKVGQPVSWEPDIRGKPIEEMLKIWFSQR